MRRLRSHALTIAALLASRPADAQAPQPGGQEPPAPPPPPAAPAPAAAGAPAPPPAAPPPPAHAPAPGPQPGGYAPTGYYQPAPQPGPPPPPYGYAPYPYPPPPPPPERRSARVHDGFFLRFGLGFGSFGDTVETDSGPREGSELSLSGSLVGLDFLMGGTVADGLVIGGGFFVGGVPAPKNELDGENVQRNSDVERGFTMVGPFLGWYPDAKGGLNLQLLVGGATLRDADPDDDDQRYEADGAGIALGAGYDFWIGDEWSFGLMARFAFAGLTRNDSFAEERHSVFLPALLLGFTYH